MFLTARHLSDGLDVFGQTCRNTSLLLAFLQHIFLEPECFVRRCQTPSTNEKRVFVTSSLNIRNRLQTHLTESEKNLSYTTSDALCVNTHTGKEIAGNEAKKETYAYTNYQVFGD